MMIALNEWQYNLLRKLEKENCSNYEMREIKGDFYITIDDLMDALDETQNYRQYAEEKVVELSDKINTIPNVECDSLQLSTIKALNELRIENDKLKKDLETIKNTLNEDDYDKLAMEGVEL
jgi:hypothetical protein